jgi:WD40 repeat protein
MLNEREVQPEDHRTICRVFLCHNSADKPLIKEIADRLELDFGTLHFLDAFAIPTGEAFKSWIERALQESTGCAIFLGANGWGPTHRWEAEQAIARRATDPNFRLIPVALPGIKEADMCALGDGRLFRDLNWADLRNGPDDQDGLDRLHSALTGTVVLDGRGPARLTPYQIRRDAARWQKSLQRDSSILYRGSQLEQSERLIRSFPELATKVEVTPFLLASARRQRSIWRRVAFTAVAAGLIIASLAVLAEVLRELAERRRVLALSHSLAIESKAEPVADTALLLAAQAYAEVPTPDAAGNLLERLQTWPHLKMILHGNTGALTKVVWDAKNNSVVAGSSDGRLLRWSIDTLKPEGQPVRASKGAVLSVAVAENQGLLWAGYEDGRVLIWDRNGQSVSVDGIPPGFDLQHIAAINGLSVGPPIGAIALSRDGTLGAVGTTKGTGDGLVFIIDQQRKKVLGAPLSVGVPRVNALDFDPQSRLLVAGTGFGTVVLIDAHRRTAVRLVGPKMSEILAVRFAGDRALIAVDDVGRTSVWRRSGSSFKLLDTFETTDYLTSVSIRPDGGMLALGDARGTVQLFSVGKHDRTVSFQAHTGSVNGLAWDSRGQTLISTGSDGAASIWDFGQSSPITARMGRLNPRVLALRVAKGDIIAGRSSVGSSGVWQQDRGGWKLKIDLLKATLAVLGKNRFEVVQSETGRKEPFVPVPVPEIERIEMDSLGTRVAWATRDGAVLWSPLNDGAPATLVYDVQASGVGSVTDLSLSQSGRYLAIAYSDRQTLLFDLTKTYEHGIRPEKSIAVPAPVRSLSLNRAETLLATGLEDGSVALWSVPDGTSITPPARLHAVAVGNVTFAADDHHLLSNAVVGDGDEVSLTASPIPSLSPTMPLVARSSGDPPALIRADEHLVITIDNDGTISFWDAAKLQPLGSMSPSGLPITAAAFYPEDQQLIVADEDGWLQNLQVGGARWQALACALANRTLTHEEWAEFLRDDHYSPVCGSGSR